MSCKFNKYTLKSNKSKSLPQRCIYFDCETLVDPTQREYEQEFRLLVAKFQSYTHGQPRYQPQWLGTKDRYEFWTWVEEHTYPKTKTYLFAHNMDFDWAASDGFQSLLDRGWELKFWAIDSTVWILKFRKGKRSLVVLDTLQYFRYSLKAVGEHLGTPKMDMPQPDQSDDKWFTYCKRDVQILCELVESSMDFICKHDLGSFSYTSAGQSLSGYRHRFMNHPIQIHRIEGILNREVNSYQGGRTEAFYLGTVPDSPVYQLDVNSMYPYVMTKYDYPCKFLGGWKNPTLGQLDGAWDKFCVILEAEVKVHEPALACRTDKLIFPVGKFTGHFTTQEVKYLCRSDATIDPKFVAFYKKAPLFDDYVDYFYQVKQDAKTQGDRIAEDNAKLFLNSLYGKWGQRNPTWEKGSDQILPEFGTEVIINSATGETTKIFHFGKHRWVQSGWEWPYHGFPAISSEVTANARMYLWELIRTAGRENVFYCDTDSLFVNIKGLDNLGNYLHNDKLGHLSLEAKADKMVINGLKDYKFGEMRKIKGIPHDAVQTDIGTYRYTTFKKFRTRAAHGEVGHVKQIEVTKELSRDYDKGIVDKMGWIKPLTMA